MDAQDFLDGKGSPELQPTEAEQARIWTLLRDGLANNLKECRVNYELMKRAGDGASCEKLIQGACDLKRKLKEAELELKKFPK
jgi:hypothetical protein